MAMAAQGMQHAQTVLASNHTKDTQKDAGTQAETKAVEETLKEPARQVPVEPFDEPASTDETSKNEAEKKLEKPTGDAVEKTEVDETAGEPEEKSVKKAPDPSTGSPDVKAKEDKPAIETKKPVKQDASANEAEMTVPGLPIRKPRKPVFRKKRDDKKSQKKPAPPSSARDKELCKMLQKCRNAFIKCKSKIKHPDQSEPWIIAKEVCGSHYKTCVEKDFQGGEWFMTRWFYFQELNCGE